MDASVGHRPCIEDVDVLCWDNENDCSPDRRIADNDFPNLRGTHISAGVQRCPIVDATSWFAEMCPSPRPLTEDIDVLGSDHEADRTVEMCTDHRPSIEDIDILGSVHEYDCRPYILLVDWAEERQR